MPETGVNLLDDVTLIFMKPDSLISLQVLPGELAICKLSSKETIPAWTSHSSFLSITRTPDELSVTCDHRLVPVGVTSEAPWRALRIKGTLDFSLTGILSSLSAPLAKNGISIFVVSTFSTDYLLVKTDTLTKAVSVLTESGFEVSE
jgi:hypothetical protein